MKLPSIYSYALLVFSIKIKMILPNEVLAECLHDIFERDDDISKAAILINVDLTLKYPVYKLKPGPEFNDLIYEGTRFNIIIIDERILSIRNLVQWDFKRQYFNPQAAYFILTDRANPQLFQFFGKYYIPKVYVIDRNLSIYGYRPYAYESANKPNSNPVKIGDCPNIPNTTNIFEVITPKYWRNTTLRDCFRIIDPYATKKNDGLENKFIELAQERLGFKRQSIILPHISDHTLDLLSAEGTELLRNHKANVLAGFNSPTNDTPKYFDISGACYSDAIAWISPSASKTTHWKRMSKIFSPRVWILLVSSALLWIAIIHTVHKSVHIFNLSYMVLQILLEHSVSKQGIANKVSFRIMLSAWMIAFLVISTLFKNSLLVILGTEKYDPRLYFMKNIVSATHLKITSNLPLSELYTDKNNHKEYSIDLEHIEYCSSVLSCVNRSAFGRDVITTAPKAIVRYNWIPKYYINSEGEVLIVVSRDVIKPFFIHLIFAKGYPLFTQINDILIRMAASGWFNHQYNEMRLKIKRATIPLVFEAEKIGLNKFRFVFIMWGIGLFISTLTFWIEILMYKRNVVKLTEGLN